MNDRHPSGIMTTPTPASDAASAHYASYGTQEAEYDGFATYHGYETGAFDAGAHATGHFTPADPLFGEFPGDGTTSATGTFDTTQWGTGGHQVPDTGSHQILHHDGYAAQHHAAYDTGAYDASAWSPDHHQQLNAVPQQGTAPDASGQWDASAWLQPDQSVTPADRTQQWEWGTQAFDTGAYDATQWNSDGGEGDRQASDEHEQQAEVPFDQQATATFEQVGLDEHASAGGELPDSSPLPLLDDQEETAPAPVPGGRAAARNANRSRRRMPAKRSALLTVAVPSACVMGVAGIAAASVGTLTGGDDKDTTASASDAQPVKPVAANNKLDAQLETLSAGADDFADRASRTQERIDLKTQQEAEKKKAAAEAARKERLRPKYALPVAQHGLSAYFGQAGINWMSQHTGIDFPVSYGTTVMAATDGTVRTQWNSAYGNMMIVTSKDGTETWYCHLSSYRVSSGTTVKAGDAIAYSGNSGNSTGPHLHFEVRPAGGSAIDPLPWLRSHGLNPT
ncbi:murein DD-endopeptidase MepM/ murein hydrolase activator NlpD [Streptomyces sp. 3330]|uniref:M23 family metallopeptidase n=1 Tax=Streptomyces sp. 3330 TaxID=2817755 RepID=UPI00286190B4|nr:M23 family metallopeptidase [Streptomyces sp. 3330]MDR6975521.1 murein DD-endopeptidase MepM/ murein hydrolase activator NlpD [Streptomyces sp. 3330]